MKDILPIADNRNDNEFIPETLGKSAKAIGKAAASDTG
jgi:hypothetical protein